MKFIALLSLINLKQYIKVNNPKKRAKLSFLVVILKTTCDVVGWNRKNNEEK